jgi:hypothetical protein
MGVIVIKVGTFAAEFLRGVCPGVIKLSSSLVILLVILGVLDIVGEGGDDEES